MSNILIIGGGAWGLAIASLIKCNLQANDTLTVYSRSITENKNENGFYFTDKIKGDFFDIAFICIPLLAFEDFFSQHKNSLKSCKNFVICSKGYLKPSMQSGYEFVKGIFGSDINTCVLSGPNFAAEVLQKQPTITTIASKHNELLNQVEKLVNTDYFKCQKTDDEIGASILGLFKNAIAIGFGIICSYNNKHLKIVDSTNAKSMYLSICIKQVEEFILASGASTNTINLSCGIGDIFLSCSDLKSRNVSFGLCFGRELNLLSITANKQNKEQIIQSSKQGKTVEGIDSIFTINNLCNKLNLHLPIYNALYRLLFEDITYDEFIKSAFLIA